MRNTIFKIELVAQVRGSRSWRMQIEFVGLLHIWLCVKAPVRLVYYLHSDRHQAIINIVELMAQNLDNYSLETVNDYKFLSLVLGAKLRNPNFLPAKREIFLKALLQQIRPACSLKTYERIQKFLNEIAHQKDLDEKQLKAKMKQQSNRKEKKLVAAKQTGYVDKFGVEIDDYGSEEDEEPYSDEQYDDYKR